MTCPTGKSTCPGHSLADPSGEYSVVPAPILDTNHDLIIKFCFSYFRILFKESKQAHGKFTSVP